MTWTSHTLMNGALALAATGRPALACGAMLTAALPDKLEAWLPFAKHRGFSHWLSLWVAAFAGVVGLLAMPPAQTGTAVGATLERWALQIGIGLALGPLLHVVLDGFSAAGVPLGAPFGRRRRLRLGVYRTNQTRRLFSLDLSEVFFVAALLVLCVLAWRIAWMP